MDAESKKLNTMLQVYLNRLMVGALDLIELIYGKTDSEKFKLIRQKLLRLGNNQKRDVEKFFEDYSSSPKKAKYDIEFKGQDNINRKGE